MCVCVCACTCGGGGGVMVRCVYTLCGLLDFDDHISEEVWLDEQ